MLLCLINSILELFLFSCSSYSSILIIDKEFFLDINVDDNSLFDFLFKIFICD